MIKCFYCHQPIRSYGVANGQVVSLGFVADTPARVRKVANDPDGITEIHYERSGHFFKVSHVVTTDGPACPECMKGGKEQKKAKQQKGENSRLADEMKARGEKVKDEKKNRSQIAPPVEVPSA